MIDGLDNLLDDSGQPGLVELRQLLRELLEESRGSAQVMEQRRLPARRPRAYRLRFAMEGWMRSMVAKRLELDIAQRVQLAVRRWLPAAGLGDHGPKLLGVAAERTGQWVWHVYDDLGAQSLDPAHVDPQQVRSAVDLIAQLHLRFAGHALLSECRLLGTDYGIHFYAANVRDAIRCLELLRRPEAELNEAQARLSERLWVRLHKLQEEQPMRARIMGEAGGAETLLHGDLWTSHVFALPSVHGVQVCLAGWDHVGVGPVSYDLSTFLLRFPLRYRLWVLDLYRDAMSRGGGTVPTPGELNVLFETAEFARFANCIIWPVVALVHDHLGWGFDELANVEQWFQGWEPVLPAVES